MYVFTFSQGGSYNNIDVLLIIDAKSRDVGVSENGCFEKRKKGLPLRVQYLRIFEYLRMLK